MSGNGWKECSMVFEDANVGTVKGIAQASFLNRGRFVFARRDLVSGLFMMLS